MQSCCIAARSFEMLRAALSSLDWLGSNDTAASDVGITT